MEKSATRPMQGDPVSDPPPVAPRRVSQSLSLRRYHSSNSGTCSKTMEKPYESEYDKLNKILHRSLKVKSFRQHHDNEYATVQKKSNSTCGSTPKPQWNSRLSTAEENEDLYLAAGEIASLPKEQASFDERSNPLLPLTHQSEFDYQTDTLMNDSKHLQCETAIYGVAQGIGDNFVMELKELQRSANTLYRKLLNTSSNAPEMADLRNHLRTGDQAPTATILMQIYQTLHPPESPEISAPDFTEIHLVDFRGCIEKGVLREKLRHLFAAPGLTSTTLQKVTTKLDAVINDFVEIVTKMKKGKNETIASPYHAQSVLKHCGQEGENLVRALQANELWIRWGTETGLPPLSHIYMLKHPPTYEMRKAIVLSMIADKKDAISSLPANQWRNEFFIPPIYSKLASDDNSWQVTEYNPHTREFQTSVAPFPQWVEESQKLTTHLKSSNRSSFPTGEHVYALYSVYLIVIKDITMTAGESFEENRTPCNHQISVCSSSTGVLFRFLTVENNHCDNIRRILEKGTTMTSFRCHHDVNLDEAYLALSWIRRQPRAVFVTNSLQEGNMTNLSLKKKKPYHAKMLALEHHYIHSRKLGPTNDMRYGMNRLGDESFS